MSKLFKKICLLILSVSLCCMTACDASSTASISSSESSSSSVLSQYGFDYEIVDDSVRITKCYDYGRIIYVPDELGGKPVKILGRDSFYQHTDTVSITLPETLTTLECSPFYRCYSLEEITIPASVSSIVDGNPFFRCSSLQNITVASDNPNFSDIDGVLFNKEHTEIISYPEGNPREEYTIPESVKRIVAEAFGYHPRNLKTLIIKSNVTDFPDYNIFIYPDDIILKVEKGSAAEEYAKEYELRYEII